jgi:hypothetical protein
MNQKYVKKKCLRIDFFVGYAVFGNNGITASSSICFAARAEIRGRRAV